MAPKIPSHYFANLSKLSFIRPLSPDFYVKHYELNPILFVMSWVVGTCIATCIRNPIIGEFQWTRNTKTPAQDLDMLIHPRHTKLLHFGQVYEPNQEAYDILKDMEKAEKEQAKNNGGKGGNGGGGAGGGGAGGAGGSAGGGEKIGC